MSYETRQEIIRDLQRLRGTKVITHVNSDRRSTGPLAPPSLQTKMGTEAQPFFYKALRELGKHTALDLFLYTSGGQTDSVWPLVSLFREYGELFNILVAYKAHSAGTLLCLGANTVVMGEAGELSPVDPSTGNQYNPINEVNKNERKAISVEEVTSYFDLVEDPAKKEQEENSQEGETKPGIVDSNMAFQILARKVHPLALGNVNRSHKQIRALAKRLLELHMGGGGEETAKQVRRIVNALTQGRYSHTDILNRKEAKVLLGDEMLKFSTEDEQRLMYALYDSYADSISMLKPFGIDSEIGNTSEEKLTNIGSFIETENKSFIYRSVCTLYRMSDLPPNYNIQIQPGQGLPIIPGLPVKMSMTVNELGWAINEEGI